MAEAYAKAGFVEQREVDPDFFYQTKTDPKQINLSDEERAWLAQVGEIRVAVDEFSPFSFSKVGGVDGYSVEYLKLVAQRVGVRLKYVKGNFKDQLDRIRKREVDLILSLNITASRIHSDVELGVLDEPDRFCFGFRKDWSILRDMFHWAMKSISNEELTALQEKWFQEQFAGGLGLTKEERVWLAAHPSVRVVMGPEWAPVEFRDKDGSPQGISMDYLLRLQELLGIRLTVAEGLSWDEGVEEVRNKKLDMVISMVRTDEIEKLFLFTKPYISMAINVFSRNDVSYIGKLDNLENRRVAVVEGYAVVEWLNRDYPEIELVATKSASDALKMVASGEVDAFVGNVVVASYYIGKLHLTNVRIDGETPYSYDQSMAVRDDCPIFAGILQKALNASEQPERDAMFNRWMSIKYEHGFDYTLLWQAMAVFAIILIPFLYWNRRLATEVIQRKQAEATAEESREDAEATNQAKSLFLTNMSHEIRTPMNTVLGFAEILKREESDKKKIHYIENIYSGGKALLSLINDILDLSKVEAGKLDLQYSAVSIDKLLAEIKVIFEYKISDQGLEFIIEKSNNVPPLLVLDEARVRQILINLLSNAVKFTKI